jgi:hypothetical protein
MMHSHQPQFRFYRQRSSARFALPVLMLVSMVNVGIVRMTVA